MPSKHPDPEAQLNLGDIHFYDFPVTYGKPDSYADVATRAFYLIQALDSISQRNIREGLSVAAFTMPHSEKIWGEYQENTDGVLEGAERNRENYGEILKVSFWRATGFAALRGSGLMRERQIGPRARKMWRDFNHQFGHPSSVDRRIKYRKQLEESLERTMAMRERNLTGEVAA